MCPTAIPSCKRVLITSNGWNIIVAQAPDPAPDAKALMNETCREIGFRL